MRQLASNGNELQTPHIVATGLEGREYRVLRDGRGATSANCSPVCFSPDTSTMTE
jgi:hypothetical protein